MGAALMGGGGKSRRGGKRRRAKRAQMSEINVTPFVDVMLVLLIIFMVTAPLLTIGVEIDLPDAEAPAITGQDEPLTISVTAGGALYLNDEEIPAANLVGRLKAMVGERTRDARVFVRGDESTSYGQVIETWGMIKAAGFDEVALIVDMPDTE